MQIPVAYRQNDYCLFTIDSNTLQFMQQKLANNGVGLTVERHGPSSVLCMDNYIADVGEVVNYVFGDSIVPARGKHDYQFSIFYYDRVLDVYITILFKDRNKFSTDSEFGKIKSEALMHYFKTLPYSNRKQQFARFERDWKIYQREHKKSQKELTKVFEVLREGGVPSEELLKNLKFFDDSLVTQIRELSSQGCGTGLSSHVLRILDVHKYVFAWERGIYTNLLKKKDTMFTLCIRKECKNLDEACEEAYRFDSKCAFSMIVRMDRIVYFVVSTIDCDINLSEFCYEEVNELLLAHIKEHAEIIMTDAIHKVQKYKL